MKGKIVWLLVNCLIVATLVLGSCRQAAEPTPTPTPAPEGPQYGGVFNQMMNAASLGNDEAFAFPWATFGSMYPNERLVIGDMAKGPRGTGEASWLLGNFPPQALLGGSLAESWEIVDAETLIFNIRKGVHWQDIPPVNGRELTADDVVFSLKRIFESPKSYAHRITASRSSSQSR